MSAFVPCGVLFAVLSLGTPVGAFGPVASSSTASVAVAVRAEPAGLLRLEDVLRGLDQTGTPPGPTKTSTDAEGEPVLDAREGPERYQGRAEPATEAEDVLIWVPRVLFAPVWIVTEFVLRRPVVYTVTRIEEAKLIDRFVDALTFLDGDLTLFPRFLADFGVRPSVGLSIDWQNFVTDRTSLGLNGSFWGPRWLAFSGNLSVRALRQDSAILSLLPEFVLRPDYPYFGYGSRTLRADERRYQARQAGLRMQLQGVLSGLNRTTFGGGYRHVSFLDEADQPALDLSAAANDRVSFDTHQWLFGYAGLELDSRDTDVEFTPGSGVRAELSGQIGFDPAETSRRALRLAAELAGFWDISSIHHVLSLALHASMLERLGGGPIPVTQLIALGGAEQMRAYLPGRFVGDSAWSVTLSYRWPVWILLDAEVFAELGNVHPGRFEDFRFDHAYLGWGAALRSSGSREVNLSLLVGFGTDRLDESDLRPALTRFTLNISRGF